MSEALRQPQTRISSSSACPPKILNFWNPSSARLNYLLEWSSKGRPGQSSTPTSSKGALPRWWRIEAAPPAGSGHRRSEGMTAVAVVLATDRSPMRPSFRPRPTASNLRRSSCESIEQSRTLHRCFALRAHIPRADGLTAVANSRSKLETRLARWLLMAHDRSEGGNSVTHEFLATMLGVRRPGVTVGLNFLEKLGLIRVRRGGISVVDRRGLEQAARHAYGAPEAEFKRLFG